MENVKEYRLKIVTGQYQNAPLDQQKMIQELFGKNAEHSYEIYFHWYNVIHELGHAIMMFNSSSRPHPAEEEQMVNDFAYAYWKYYGEQEKLKELDYIIEETIQKFTIPADNSVSYLDYAKDKWGTEELFTFNNNGWVQFSSVKAAITGGTSLEQALSRMCSGKISPQIPKVMEYKICTQMPVQIIADAVKELRGWGVSLPEGNEIVFGEDVNCHMCQIENLRDGRIF